MTTADTELLKERIQFLMKRLSHEKNIAKQFRDQREIDSIHRRVAKIKSWIYGKG